MARSIESKENLKLIRSLITNVTGFETTDENFSICEQFVVSNLKYHRFLDVDSHKVTRQLQGICDKLRIHSETTKASKLQELAQVFLDTPGFEGRTTGKTDTQYAILSFLLLVSDNPIHSEYIETDIVRPAEVKDEFDWGAYLLEGIERYDPSDGELSDWSEEEDSDQGGMDRVTAPDDSSETTQDTSQDCRQQNIVPYYVPDDSTAQWEEPEEMTDSDWLKANLIAQYWKGEELEIDNGRYRACQLNNDWEAYKQRTDPLQGSQCKIVVTENILLREVIWMLMGISQLHLVNFNGRFFSPRPDVRVPTLSEEVLQECLTQYTRYGSYVQILQNFVEETYHESCMCQTYQSFALAVADFLQCMKSDLVKIEQRLIKQEELLTLITVSQELQPVLQKVAVLCMVYMRGIHQGKAYKLVSQKATLLLTTLYNTLLGVDTLFEMSVLYEDDPGGKLAYEPAELTRLLLPMWVQTCQPYINIIDTWISNGYLSDPCREFVIQRNKKIRTLDETFWDKSFTFHTMMKDVDDSGTSGTTHKDEKDKSRREKKGLEFDIKDWAPQFLQPVLQEVMLTGKSMEMLEGLGKLAEEHDGKNNMDTLKEFKETNLYDKFVSSIKVSIGMKVGKGTGEYSNNEDSGEVNHGKSRMFSPEVERQMKERGLQDDFLKMHFENIMNTSTESHSILEKSFSEAMRGLDLDSLQPVEVILQDCLYPHIHKQYERVCLKLVETMKVEYHLMEYLQSMRSFFLMGAGDTLSIFCSEIFDKIRLHEHWKDTGTVTWALHEALDRHFPDEVPRISVNVETTEESSVDFQPINITNCLKLQYEIPCPVDVVINERCQHIYNQIFSFLLQIKHAKYCLDELRFSELAKESASSNTTDRLLKSLSLDNTPRKAKIHCMHLLRMKLINFINSLHYYMMTRILHSVGLEFTRDLSQATDLDQIVEIHAGYIRKIHERCLLHEKNAFLKAAVVKVLNLALRFQKEWDCGIDNISMKQIEETETEFSRCIQFLTYFLKSVLQRRAFPHLESLAFSLENLIPR